MGCEYRGTANSVDLSLNLYYTLKSQIIYCKENSGKIIISHLLFPHICSFMLYRKILLHSPILRIFLYYIHPRLAPGLIMFFFSKQFLNLSFVAYNARLADRPKHITIATGDQFFLPDDSYYFFDQLEGVKYMQ